MKNQKGSALMIVMFLMVVTLTMCTGAIMVAQSASVNAKSTAPAEQNYYDVESAAQLAMSRAMDWIDANPCLKGVDSTDVRTAHESSVRSALNGTDGIADGVKAEFFSGNPSADVTFAINAIKNEDPYDEDIDSYIETTYTTIWDEARGESVIDPSVAPTVTRYYLFWYDYTVSVTASAGGRKATVSEGVKYVPNIGEENDTIDATAPTTSEGGTYVPKVSGGKVEGIISKNGGPLNTALTLHKKNGQTILFGESCKVSPIDFDAYPFVTGEYMNVMRESVKTAAEQAYNDLPGSKRKFYTSNNNTIDGDTLRSQGIEAIYCNGTQTLIGDFSNISVYASGKLTLGTNSKAFTQTNTKTTYMSGSSFEINARRGFVQRGAVVSGYQFDFTSSTSPIVGGTVQMDSLYYLPSTINITAPIGSRWDSSLYPQFFGSTINLDPRSLLDLNCDFSGIFVAYGSMDANLAGVDFSGSLLARYTADIDLSLGSIDLTPNFDISKLDTGLKDYYNSLGWTSTGGGETIPGSSGSSTVKQVVEGLTPSSIGRTVQGG